MPYVIPIDSFCDLTIASNAPSSVLVRALHIFGAALHQNVQPLHGVEAAATAGRLVRPVGMQVALE